MAHTAVFVTVSTAMLSSVSPLLPTTPVMKMHTKTDFVGAFQELLGIVVAQILTSALQVYESVCLLPLLPLFLSLFEQNSPHEKSELGSY